MAEEVIAELKKHGPYDFAFNAISSPEATAVSAAVLGVQSGDIVLYSVGPADIAIPKNVSRVTKNWPAYLLEADPQFDYWIFKKYIPEALLEAWGFEIESTL